MRARSDQHGTVTLWTLGLCVAILFLGGLSLDLWRALAVRRELSAMADAAATAGANGLDEAALRAGAVVLDPARARALARGAIGAHERVDPLDVEEVAVGGRTVAVTLADHVDFSLLGIFMPQDRFVVRVHARAEARERS
jgi:Flp pilus assembly protein TadG